MQLSRYLFVKDKKIRPDNCGECSKCIRTKYMFLAAIGDIPKGVFINQEMKKSQKIKFSKRKNIHVQGVRDIYCVAYRNGNLGKIPQIATEYEKTKNITRYL